MDKRLLIPIFVFLGFAAQGQEVRTIDQKIDQVAHAIARAEGFGVKGTVPTRYHNPGNIRSFRQGHVYPGQVGLNNHGYVIFKSDRYGFAALRAQLRTIIAGESKYYSSEITFIQLAKIYATGWRPWVKNVTKILGVTPKDKVKGYVYPSVEFAYSFNLPSGR